MEINMEHYHCAYCGRYIAKHDGITGSECDKNGRPLHLYCGWDCKLEKTIKE